MKKVYYNYFLYPKSLGGDDFTPLVALLGFISAIFIIVGILIIAKFLKNTPF